MKTETMLKIEAYLEKTKQSFTDHIQDREDTKKHSERTIYLLGKEAAIRQVIAIIEGTDKF